MGIAAAEAERTDTGDPFSVDRLPVGEPGGNHERVFLPGDVRTWLLQMQVRRNLSMLEHQHDLQQARNPGCGFKVAEVGLDRTEGDRRPLPFGLAGRRAPRLQFQSGRPTKFLFHAPQCS